MLRRLAKRVIRKVTGTGHSNTAAQHVHPIGPEPEPESVAEAESMANIEAGAQEVKERLDAGEPVVLLDVRQPHETAHGIIAGSILIPLPELPSRWEEVKDCNEIVCYCAAGVRSFDAAMFLRQQGVFNATSMEGGVAAWHEAGGLLEPPQAG